VGGGGGVGRGGELGFMSYVRLLDMWGMGSTQIQDIKLKSFLRE
jgi:hypothetical protein